VRERVSERRGGVEERCMGILYLGIVSMKVLSRLKANWSFDLDAINFWKTPSIGD